MAGRLLSTEHRPRPLRAGLTAAAVDRVMLTRGRDTARDGVFGLVWDGGRTIVREVLSVDRRTVTRRVDPGSDLPPAGAKVRIDEKVYEGDPASALGLTFEEVAVPGELGPMPAWLLDGTRPTWLIAVHGRDGDRTDALRWLGVPARLGVPTLVITYRNDAGAPASADRRYRLGATEWLDLEAAVEWALQRGAAGVVLFGASMGATIIAQLLRESPHRGAVRAIVFDSPVLDWRSTLLHLVSRVRLPRRVAVAAQRAIARRARVDLDRLDLLRAPELFDRPVLLVQGTQDTISPPADADDFAERHADLVTYVRVDGADHVQTWNVDPARYEAALAEFLDRWTAA
jgi:hypothetical protein